MSDGAYRDDQEAAIERADALEHENQELRDKLERLEHPPVKRPAPVARDHARVIPWLVGIGALVGVLAIGAFAIVKNSRKSNRDKDTALWSALTDAGGIMRNGLVKFSWEKYDADAADPRKLNPQIVDFSESPLTQGDLRELATLLADDAYAPIADGIQAWQRAVADYEAPRKAIDDYYHHRDWKDDNYARAPQLWSALRAAAARTHVAADAIRDRFLATNHAELRRFEKRWEDANGRDETWWYAECGILLQLAADDYRMGDASKYEAEMTAFDAAVKQAPLNVRRETRDRTHELEKPFRNELFRARKRPIP